MIYDDDKRIVMTLDAGGTNFVFSAIQSNKAVVESVTLPARGDYLDQSLKNLRDGFYAVQKQLDQEPAAISFAFPGPADYPKGIIGDLVNLPAYRGGVAIGPMLEEEFKCPVFINNDGDLFAFGEAINGFLPWVNSELEKSGSPKRYHNLLGITLGTGFGAGIVRAGELFIGDNAAAAEIWPLHNKVNPSISVEEGVSIRGLKRAFAAFADVDWQAAPDPADIYRIAIGEKSGDQNAARHAFSQFGEILGAALAHASSLIDGLIVVGGGLAGAAPLFLPGTVNEMNKTLDTPDGPPVSRMESSIFNLEDKQQFQEFMLGKAKKITVPGSQKQIDYDPMKRLGIGLSRLGTSEAMSLGAYAFAVRALDHPDS